MTDLDELLHADGNRWRAEFHPPQLEPMLATATEPTSSRTRWAWPILAAVLLLAIPLITLLVHHSHRVIQPGSSAPRAPKLKLYGSAPWVQAVSQPDGRSVSVYVDTDQLLNTGCLPGYPALQASVVETDSRITIQVRAYQPADYRPPTAAPGTALGCAGVGQAPVPVLVTLPGPIAGRSIVDASTGKTYQPVPAVELPALTTLPAGYVDAGSSPAQALDQPAGVAEHTYRNGDAGLELLRSPIGSQTRYPIRHPETTGTVLGHPAKVGDLEVGGHGYRCVAWSDRSYGWQLCSTGSYPEQLVGLSAAELLSLANGIR